MRRAASKCLCRGTRHPTRVWDDCGHWLNLAGEWAPTDRFDYTLSRQTLTRWNHLHQWVRQKTADFRMLTAELNETEPFSTPPPPPPPPPPPLAAQIEECFDQLGKPRGQRERRAWLQELGQQLRLIQLDDEQETIRIRELAMELSHTLWLISPRIEITPYIDGKPAGTACQRPTPFGSVTRCMPRTSRLRSRRRLSRKSLGQPSESRTSSMRSSSALIGTPHSCALTWKRTLSF